MGKDGYKPGLDGLRGIAALSVAIFHTILGIDGSQVDRILYKPFSQLTGAYDQATWIVLKTFNGETAVALFFILSGTVLFDSLRRSNEVPKLETNWLGFLVRRALRIYPALIACLILSAAMFWLAGMPVGLRDVIENAALVSFRVNGASWTLAVEMAAALLIPVAFLGFRLGREWGLLLTGIAIALALNAPWFPSFAIKNFWPYFLAGMLIPTRAGHWIASKCPSYLCPALLLILLFAAGPTTQKICGSLLVALIYYDRAGALGHALQLRPSLFLGRISYSFYLFNVAFLEIVCASLRQYPSLVAHPLEVGAAASIVVVLATLPVACVSLIWIERPFIRLGRADKPKSLSIAPAE